MLSGVEKEREHDKIVENSKEQLRSKGFKVISFPEHEAMIAQIGYRTIKPKIAHTTFRSDIVINGNEKPEKRFFIEYVHTKERYLHDLRGMIELKENKKGLDFHSNL